MAKKYINFDEYIFCGSGPNYGSALFNSSKIIETCGDNSYAVDIEEWAHSFYFSKKNKKTLTFILSSCSGDYPRANEIATAIDDLNGKYINIVPSGYKNMKIGIDNCITINSSLRECFWPIVCVIIGSIFANYRQKFISETDFRGFKGPRSLNIDGGISRIYSNN